MLKHVAQLHKEGVSLMSRSDIIQILKIFKEQHAEAIYDLCNIKKNPLSTAIEKIIKDPE